MCDICQESFEDEFLYDIHNQIYHSIDTNSVEVDLEDKSWNNILKPLEHAMQKGRPSVIQYAPPQPKPLTVELLAQALPRSIVRHFKIKNTDYELYQFILQAKHLITETLKTELKRLNFVKFGLLMETTFTNMQNEVSLRGFLTKNKSIMLTSDIDAIVEDCLQDIVLKVHEHQRRGSGWSLLSIDGLEVRVHKHGYGDRGSSYIPLPRKLSNTKACINVKNTDNECFKYAMLVKFIKDKNNVNLPGRCYREMSTKYNFKGITYPVSLDDIKKFERQNPHTSINVFTLDGNDNVYPLQITSQERHDHTDLLLIKDGEISHYVYIKNFNTLISKQLSRSRWGITACKRCFCHVKKSFDRGGREWLKTHLNLCNEKDAVKINLPHPSKAFVKFNKTIQQYRIPIVIYADFESTLIPMESDNNESFKRLPYQQHEPNSYCLLLKSTLNEEHLQRYGLSSQPQLYRGNNAAKTFIDVLYDIATKVECLYSNIVPMKSLSEQEVQNHTSAVKCYLCENQFEADNIKVRDHCHLTGHYRGPACNRCNINYKLPRFIPVVFHNLSGYDSHYILPELGRDKGAIDVLATSTEKFISFSKKVGKIKLRFLDSFRFMSSSLTKLTENLNQQDLIETKKIVPDDKLKLVIKKGVFPYDYIDHPRRFEETTLPPAECFYSKLNDISIEPEDYEHACNVWNELDMKTLGEYSDFYVKLDVTLLCDIMEEFRNTCMTAYGLDPLHSYTSPGLAWQAMLKETNQTLQLLTDIDMLLMVESGIRGGLTQSVTRHVKANNKHLSNYNSNQESIYLGYFDANNLYGWAMSKPLAFGDFKWIDPKEIGDIMNIDKHGDVGYILECDFEYPDTCHDHHYDLPLLARAEIPPSGQQPKLMMTLNDKQQYVAHYWVVQQAIELGLRLKKVHRVLQFSQSCWLRPYIDSNTARRAKATSAFQKDFFKLMNNSIFGKTLENKRKHKNVKLVSDPAKLEKLVQQPNFKTSIIINENLVAVSMKKTVIKMDRPLYIGMSILDISKTLMYDFHYNKMVAFYGRENIGISYMDTDAFLYFIKTLDMYEDLRTFPHKNDFDFSDYPKNHPNYDYDRNKKVLGKFKDELNGVPLEENVALMSKLYAIKIHKDAVDQEECVIKKAKGIKTLYLKKQLKFENYKQCLFEDKEYIATFNTIRSFNHKLFSITEVKKALSSNDNKRVILPDKIHTLPYGHYALRKIDEI